ncbi:hypothetical protein LIA77_10837 [Sarocladium implicatum]|nr:hypothetical protein LIA77_10837 [Sarocladium implicatum]
MAVGPASATEPLRTVTHKLLDVLEEEGLYSMILEVPTLADDVEQAHQAGSHMKNPGRTIETLRSEHTQGFRLTFLLAAMPPKVLRGILRGTIIYDLDPSHPTAKTDTYAPQNPGIYVAGVVIRGRKGEWLNQQETRELARNLERYARAWLCQNTNNLVTVATARDDNNWQKKIDAIANTKKNPNCVFIKSRNNYDHVLLLSKKLKARCNVGLDPTEKVFQRQCPFYTGCADDIQTRARQYEKKSWRNVNKLLGLVCVTLTAMKLNAEIAVYPVLPVWDKGDLRLAERLVSALGRTLVTMDGYNATPCGDNTGTFDDAVATMTRRTVFTMYPWYEDHITAIAKAQRDRREFLEILEEMDKLLCEERETNEEIEDQLAELANLGVTQTWTNEELRARSERNGQKMQVFRDEAVRLTQVAEIHGILYPGRIVEVADSQPRGDSQDQAEDE